MKLSHIVPRRYFTALVAIVLVGCGTTADVTHLKKPDKALDLTGLRIVYLERESKVNSTDPRLDNNMIKKSIADLGQEVLDRLSAGLEPLGIETLTHSVQTDADARLPMETRLWLSRTYPEWPVLLVVPTGGRIFCTPCTLQTDVVMDIRSAANFESEWTVKLKQPALTPSAEIGQGATYRHFADEMLRTLLADVRGPKSP